MAELRKATLLFLVKRSEGKIVEVCLAMKKKGFGQGRWNGVGGKVGDKHEESIEQAAARETKEEIGVEVAGFYKVAELIFYFINNPEWDQKVYVFFAEKWRGRPGESEEMDPKWHSVSELPFSGMWPDDGFWLPEVLNGNLVKGVFKFGENDVILEKEVKIIDKF